MTGRLLALVVVSLALAACGRGDRNLAQTGPQPQLPKIDATLPPPMKIARPVGWEGRVPTVPDGFSITPMASDLKVPRQILVLPNGDILVAEGSGAGPRSSGPRT
ncbi:hypothetical protein [Phenylobacterium sp.]|uniref:hypothetical protein n=1 Tax=Phenylobacterium sp. TaxID=1871053 RepID=UPI0028A0485B|nr:hypothetical protein [Phenylobacterium sp.]